MVKIRTKNNPNGEWFNSKQELDIHQHIACNGYYHIIGENDDAIYYTKGGNKRVHQAKIRYDSKGTPYIRIGGCRYNFDVFFRVN